LRVYVVWQESEKDVAIMDITMVVEDTLAQQPNLQAVIVANAFMDLVDADFILTAESEEDMLEMFPNAIIQNEKEVH
jgi:hypothetical protein